MSGFFKNLKKSFTTPAAGDSSGFITFKVKCDNCSEEIVIKVRKFSDISRISIGEGPQDAELFLRKEILGKKCNNLIYIDVYFRSDFGVVSREISGGKFVE